MTLESFVATYGYSALLAGSLLEGETIVIIAGIMAHSGYLQLPWVIGVAFCGAFCADQFCFQVGKRRGKRFLEKRPHWELRVDKVRRFLVGYQAAGTRGWSLQNGAATVRMHGKDVPVRARVVSLPGFSAHGDRAEVGRWMDGAVRPPRRTFCVHGEPTALAAQAARIAARGWLVHVPRHLETVELG